MNHPITKREWLSMEGIILGFLFGVALMYWDISLWIDGGKHIVHSAIVETLLVALYLTAVVGHCSFKLPTLFTNKPMTAMITLSVLCGVVSLFFDSFAVVLLLSTIALSPIKSEGDPHFQFNAFTFKTVAAFNALTVGGGFYIGELWGLPFFISSGMDNALAGLPLLVVCLPYSILISWFVAKKCPVRIEPVKNDMEQLKGAIQIVMFLLLIILTHRPVLCLGWLLVFSSLRGKTVKLVDDFLHELKHGAFNALGLILIAFVCFQVGMGEWVAENVKGAWIGVGAMICSPFTGAMVEGANGDLQVFYSTLSWLMVGAPIFVFSSLVAIVVFKGKLDNKDLPPRLRRFASKKNDHTQEALAYTVITIPLAIGLGLCLWIGNATGLFVSLYQLMAGS